jgi:hypothetical protein
MPVRITAVHWHKRLTADFYALWFGIRGEVAAVRYGRLTAEGQPQGESRVLPDERADMPILRVRASRS